MKKDYPELNIELLDATAKWALAESQRGALSEWEQNHYKIPYETILSWRSNDSKKDTTLLDEYREEIKDNPDGFCKTAFCMAGRALYEAGIVDGNGKMQDYIIPNPYLVTNPDEYEPEYNCAPADDYHAAARHLLGLTDHEATNLFDGDNTIEDVLETVENIIAGHYRR